MNESFSKPGSSRGDEAQIKEKAETIHAAGAPNTVSASFKSEQSTSRDGARRSDCVMGASPGATPSDSPHVVSGNSEHGLNVFLFPGQGSQEIGMAADLFKADAPFRELVRRASERTGADLEKICRRGPERDLTRTKNLQPLLVCVSLGYLRHLADKGIRADKVLGHSLGEISALAAAGCVSFETAVDIAAKRGELMDAAAARVAGGMTAVISSGCAAVLRLLVESRSENLRLEHGAGKLREPAGKDACATPGGVGFQPAGSGGILPPDRHFQPAAESFSGTQPVLANDNTPGQIVLSGEIAALEQFAALVVAAKLGQCRRLAVAGAWHSPLMAQAAQEFSNWLKMVEFHAPKLPLIFNVTAETESDPQKIRQLIARNLVEPVRWRTAMASLRGAEKLALFEVGPGRVLSGLARANGFGDDVKIFNINNLRGVEMAARLD
jgi:[acyl-carrier-protein] S-malonyltransferase